MKRETNENINAYQNQNRRIKINPIKAADLATGKKKKKKNEDNSII
jgi:hypothetical protein